MLSRIKGFFSGADGSSGRHAQGDTHYRLAIQSQESGNPGDACMHFRKALELAPELEPVYRDFCFLLFQLGQLEEAKLVVVQGIRHCPASADLHFYLGNLHHEEQQFDLAVANFRQALSLQSDRPEIHANLGLALLKKGDPEPAIAAFRQALALHRHAADLWNNLGNAYHAAHRFDDAIASYRQGLTIDPQFASLHYNLGFALHAQNKHNAAMAHYRTALEIDPYYADAHNGSGNILHVQHKTSEAILCYRRALASEPRHMEAHTNLGSVLRQARRFMEAITHYAQVIAMDPVHATTYSNIGATLRELGRLDDAMLSLHRALSIQPGLAEAHGNLGNVLHDSGKINDAVTAYRRALKIDPDHVETHTNLGYALHSLGNLDEASTCYRRALDIRPDYVEAHCYLANVMKDQGQLDDAIAGCRHALEIKPDFAQGHCNLGDAQLYAGRLDDALLSYRRVLEIEPDFTKARSVLLFILNFLPSQSAAALLMEAQIYGALVEQQARPYADWRGAPDPERRLRVGFVSGDFRHHPVGFFLENVLTALKNVTQGRLELVAYSNHYLTDQVTAHIQSCCHTWRTVFGLSDEAAARMVRDDGIDILIDLSGHTAHNRLPLFAWKPAPIQATWLGYFPTTGVRAIDYRIADPWIPPPSDELYFTEKIFRLPETYVCFTPPNIDAEVSPLPALINDHITFGSFNNLSKINDDVIALWARILQAVSNSRLFLKTAQLTSAGARKTVTDRFAVHGIAADRLILEGHSSRAEHLAAYGRVDIALDPFPMPGGTTTVEALWMGVPVLTLLETHFMSHIGESTMQNAGLPEWIAANDDEYLQLAATHAQDLQRLAQLRAGLRQQVMSSPLFDAPRFARHFDAALRTMWSTWCTQQLSPES